MGIKNLAFCEAEISWPVKDSLDATMHVLRWEKMDLVGSRDGIPGSEVGESESESESEGRIMGEADDDDDVDVVDAYSLNILSKTAYGLVKNTILAASPDVILIEKQRWRSGGGSAVQQWTLRVNTLEGMLWAILQTMYSERLITRNKKAGEDKEKLFNVFGVDPKRVGMYWLGEQGIALTESASSSSSSTKQTPPPPATAQDTTTPPTTPNKKPLRSKAEKSAKITLLRTWLSASPPSTASTNTNSTTPSLSFNISPQARATQQALCSLKKKKKKKKTPRRRKDDGDAREQVMGPTEMKKLDDITDCFLQAAAWVSWEGNRLQLCGVLEGMKNGNGKEGEVKGKEEELDEGVLGEMVGVLRGK